MPILSKCKTKDGDICLCGNKIENTVLGRVCHFDCPNYLTTWLRKQNVDWNRSDKLYWKNIFERAKKESYYFIEDAEDGDYSTYSMSDTIKYIRYCKRAYNKTKTFNDHVYGRFIDKWIANKIVKLVHKMKVDCVDNYRWAEITNRPDMRRYRRAQRRGCCGSIDVEVIYFWSRRKFMIGFNYGH